MVPIWNQSLESSQYGNIVGENGKDDLHLKSLRKLNEILAQAEDAGSLGEVWVMSLGWLLGKSTSNFQVVSLFGPPNSSAYFSRCEVLGSSFSKNSSPWMFFFIQLRWFKPWGFHPRSTIGGHKLPPSQKRVTNHNCQDYIVPITLWFSDQKITIPKA